MDLYELIKDLNWSSTTWQIVTPLCFSCADYVTGFIQAVINRDVQSKKMRTGLLHKALIFLVIILSFIFHYAFNLKYVSTFVCSYVVFMEIISIGENLKKAGINIGKASKTLDDIKENETNEENKKKLEKVVKIIEDKEE